VMYVANCTEENNHDDKTPPFSKNTYTDYFISSL
jgi:hypothetical protein